MKRSKLYGNGDKMKLSNYRAWIVLAIDVYLIFTCNILVFLPNYLSGDIQMFNLVMHIILLNVCVFFFQLRFKTYDSLWRYAESREYLVLLGGAGCGYLVYTAINLVLDTNSIWIVRGLFGMLLALMAMLTLRFVYRLYRFRFTRYSGAGRSQVAIIGTGTAGVSLLHELVHNSNGHYIPYCLFDDAEDKIGKSVFGVPVKGPIDRLPELLADTNVTEIILAIPTLSPERRAEVLKVCAKTNCRLHILDDPLMQLERPNASLAGSMRQVRIEDLLGRPAVRLDNPRISTFLRDKTILVTGGGGSIGSELCRQIAQYGPKRLIVLDIAENSVYDLQQDLIHRFGSKLDLVIEIGSVRDYNKIDRLFAYYRPNLVFHAAAHKHVPLMEHCPEEAIKNNVFGTYHTALAAQKYHVEKFVLISTDKAVNPTNIMGATKYLCEQVLQGLRERGQTEFAAVRFGNVLGSNGSVIPLFQKQIAYGGPVTITDKRIVRYFMTIPEAVSLVLEAGSLAHSGEVFVLDMGQPVHILDLAENLIRLSGYTPYVDIKIKEVGLRPGEKLYEELLTKNANLSRTENEKIFVEQRQPLPYDQLSAWLNALSEALEQGARSHIFEILHQLVPTFKDPEEVNRQAEEQVRQQMGEGSQQQETDYNAIGA
ncbi:polysaccharide biosynthesis protein [Pseudoflavonifractor phocaeensis]|nr:polysaccharide biosynthesis protein [Pseudoflavonifractor phocaeensis]